MKKLLQFCAILLVFAASSFAGVIYGNLGQPGNTYSSFLYAVPDSPTPLYQAVVFSAISTGNLADILVPAGNDNGLMNFGLYTDGGTQPGSLLESWVNIPVTSTYGQAALIDLTSALNPLLTAGTTYWFVGSTITGDLFWDQSNASDTQTNFLSFNDSLWLGPFSNTPGYALQVDGTPEPGTGVLLLCGTIGAAICRKKFQPR